jgi:4,5-DOPA dioxygenase extradiol
MPAVYLGHGAPPLVDDPLWVAQLAAWAAALPRPRAILMVSAHWTQAPLTFGATAPGVPLVYDFYGFPERYYQTTYPAPAAPELAERVRGLLEGVEPVQEDSGRGLDHGAYVPLLVMYPEADVPVLQISMPSLDPERLLELGRRLRPLRDEGVLIIGSGLSYHNLRYFFRTDATSKAASDNFDTWLGEAITAEPSKREQLLINWHQAPNALDCHPRSEHLIPLMVAAGAAANDAGHIAYTDKVLGKSVSGFQFGSAPVQ